MSKIVGEGSKDRNASKVLAVQIGTVGAPIATHDEYNMHDGYSMYAW